MSQERTINTESLAEQVYTVLKADLTSLRWQQGARIVIEQIESELNISRIPIRDALQKLTDEGLVNKRPRVGYFVPKFSKRDIEDLFRVRTVIETYSLSRGLAGIDKDLLFSLETRYKSYGKKSVYSDEDERALFNLDNRFHQDLIVANGRSPLMNKFYNEIKSKITMVSHMSLRMNDDVKEHLAIIEAIIGNDQQKAIKMLNLHLTLVEKTIMEQLVGENNHG